MIPHEIGCTSRASACLLEPMHLQPLFGSAIVVLGVGPMHARAPCGPATLKAAVSPPGLTAAAVVEGLVASRAQTREEHVTSAKLSGHCTTSGRRFDTALVSGHSRPETMRSHRWAIRPYTGSPVSSARPSVSLPSGNLEVLRHSRRSSARATGPPLAALAPARSTRPLLVDCYGALLVESSRGLREELLPGCAPAPPEH